MNKNPEESVSVFIEDLYLLVRLSMSIIESTSDEICVRKPAISNIPPKISITARAQSQIFSEFGFGESGVCRLKEMMLE